MSASGRIEKGGGEVAPISQVVSFPFVWKEQRIVLGPFNRRGVSYMRTSRWSWFGAGPESSLPCSWLTDHCFTVTVPSPSRIKPKSTSVIDL